MEKYEVKGLDHYKPERIPPIEVGEILCCMVEHGLADDEQTEELRERILAGPSVKFSNYIPDCPGWIGDLYFVVWGWHNRVTYLGRASHSREWQIVYDGELYKEFTKTQTEEKPKPPPEEIKKAEERLRKLDGLADKCAWDKFQTQLTKDQRIARGFWTAIMDEQTAWETKWGM